MNFDVFFKKSLCLGKTAITFAYEVGLKSFLYEKVSTRKVTSEFIDHRSFRQFLESKNSKGKIDFLHFKIREVLRFLGFYIFFVFFII
jgi:hypothetical protein